MKSMRLWALLLLLASSPAFSQENIVEPTTEPSPLVIENVECRGNVTISCDFIRRKLRLSANTSVDDDDVQSAQLRLSALPNFESVRVSLEKGSEKGRARLIIEVVEASPIVTELALGVQYVSSGSNDSVSNPYYFLGETLTGRISHQNLFKRQKIAELAVQGSDSSTQDGGIRSLSATFLYIDPNFLEIDRLFLSLTGTYGTNNSHFDAQVETSDPFPASRQYHGDTNSRLAQVELSLGYRFLEYSYVVAGFEHFQAREVVSRYLSSSLYDSGYSTHDSYIHRMNKWRLGYGWDSEDDPYFPTRGSRLSATAWYSPREYNCPVCNKVNWRAAYKHTWMMGRNSAWAVNIGGEPESLGDRLRPVHSTNRDGGLGLTYAYLLSSTDALGGMRRGRWYMQLGTGPVELSNEGRIGGSPDQVYLTIGLRFESKVLGVVDLYATGGRYWPRSYR